MASMTDRLMDDQAMSFINQVGDIYKSLPHLPDGVVEFLVNIAPWLALIGAILGIISGPFLAIGGLLGSLLTLNPLYAIGMIVTIVVVIAQTILMLMAFGPLKNREMKGWILVFWSEVAGVVSAIASAITFMTGGSIVGAIIGALIGFYFLFEMRPKYGPMASIAEKAK